MSDSLLKSNSDVVSECSSNSDINDNSNNLQLLKKRFVCSVNDCGKEFARKVNCDKHMRRCHSDKTLRCDHFGCDYMTSDIEYLKQHLLVHSADRPFTCNTDGCKKTFKKKIYLRKHQNSHISQMLFCTEEGCHQIFETKIQLKQHIDDIHSSTPKSFVICSDCGLNFETKRRLHCHQKDHQMVCQPIICQIDDCNKEFNSLYLYGHHIQICHSGQQFRRDHSEPESSDTKRSSEMQLNHSGGEGWYPPTPPWGRSAKFTKLAKSRLFFKIFLLILFRMV